MFHTANIYFPVRDICEKTRSHIYIRAGATNDGWATTNGSNTGVLYNVGLSCITNLITLLKYFGRTIKPLPVHWSGIDKTAIGGHC